jgi:iron complex outermembrane receptor protein
VVGGVLRSWTGNIPTGIPAKTGNVWLAWVPLSEWQLQMGVRYVGDRFLDNANTTKAPSVTLIDAGVRRRFGDSLAVDVRASNLLDKFYIQGASGAPIAVRGRYGAPRTIEATLDVRF